MYVVYYFIERQQKVCCVAGSEEINSDEDLLAVLSGGKKRIEPIKEEATSLDDPSEPETKDTKPETNKEAAKSVKVTFAFLFLHVSKLPLFLIFCIFFHLCIPQNILYSLPKGECGAAVV